jgi:DNA-binding transcriptional ArsR family regulator
VSITIRKDAHVEIQIPRLLDWEGLGQASECLKTLAHPVRLRMVQMMLHSRYTVGELAKACEVPSHMASEHLRLMQRCGLLDCERQGRRTFYQVSEPHLKDMLSCIESRFGG